MLLPSGEVPKSVFLTRVLNNSFDKSNLKTKCLSGWLTEDRKLPSEQTPSSSTKSTQHGLQIPSFRLPLPGNLLSQSKNNPKKYFL